MTFKDQNFCSKVFLASQKHQLLTDNSRYLLAVSGGLDSMVLLDFFRRFAKKKFKSRFIVAHLDHGLRPESGDDAQWLQDACAAQNLDCVSTRIKIKDLLASSQHSSLEALARECRYDWLLSQAQKHDCRYIVTAHHANDQAETILMRLIRGSQRGLSGMPYCRALEDCILIRPFLGLTRTELESYAQYHQIVWREDASNHSQDFFRNRVRSQLMPLLLEENPQLLQQLNAHSQSWRDEQDWISKQAKALFADLVEPSTESFQIQCKPLIELHPALQRALVREILTAYTGRWCRFTQTHIEAIIDLAHGPGAKSLDLPAALHVTKRSGRLQFILKPIQDNRETY